MLRVLVLAEAREIEGLTVDQEAPLWARLDCSDACSSSSTCTQQQRSESGHCSAQTKRIRVHTDTDRQAENVKALLRTVFHAVHIGYVAAVLREHLNNDRIKIPRSVAHVPRPP